jgi:opacity protein-like surface antigen
MRQFLRNIGALLLVVGTVLAIASAAGADAIGPITFESSQGYLVGDINGQPMLGSLPNGKWEKTGLQYDAKVVLVSDYPAASGYGFGSQALQISDFFTSGSFGDQTFSPGLADEAGESGADNAGLSGGLRQPHFGASFLIGTTQAAVQPGLHMSVSPDRGDGARMSYLRFEDQADGVHVFFIDAIDKGPIGTVANFRESEIATLSRASSHLIQFSIDFKDGAANDTVKIYIDSKLVKTGTTWEDYYRYDPEQTPQGNKVPTVDKLLFLERGTANTDNLLKGFLVDRVTLASSGLNLRK